MLKLTTEDQFTFCSYLSPSAQPKQQQNNQSNSYMEALAFGNESTQSCHSKFQRAGHSERIQFVSEIVAVVESGARQPIHLCNNRAFHQGHTRNTLSKPHQAETKNTFSKPHQAEIQTQINKPS